jgi:hypothetical protein
LCALALAVVHWRTRERAGTYTMCVSDRAELMLAVR